jgi:tRNA G18 (ribose-2'-O)-methylase SpoU
MIKENSRFAESTVFEGMTSIRAIIDNLKNNVENARKISKILFDESKAKSKYKELGYLKKMGELFSFDVEAVSEETISSLSIGNSHGGIIALCEDRTYPTLTKDSIKENGFYVMIEGIEDPYNFGYALRSMYASGVDGIILSERNWLSAAGVVCRSSAGASERADVYIANDNTSYALVMGGTLPFFASISSPLATFSNGLQIPGPGTYLAYNNMGREQGQMELWINFFETPETVF